MFRAEESTKQNLLNGN
uniref:Uncharacterized protein n=1 Tax=Rhizophora mucronata TaxID=61149 RepID=A0A2P2NB60_RHIMU